ncbi:MAG: methyltransferase [Desulfocapsa sp.]|nr:methyltransferase [Desulfocapsa sp.]
MTSDYRTRDTLFDGDLYCLQHRDGYRFSIDPVLLAHFVRLGKEETVLDLGAGCGVLGLILLYRASRQIRSLTAFELQAELVECTRENVSLNRFQDKMEVVEGDLCHILRYLEPEFFSTVVCNPPFYKAGTGRSSVNEEALIARHQVACTLAEILSSAAAVLQNKGRLFMVYPAEGLGSLLGQLSQQRLIIKRLQLVYSYSDPISNARLLLLEAVKNGGDGLEVLPPFYIYDQKDGVYSAAMQRLYEPNRTHP